jgi:hypothetical protein
MISTGTMTGTAAHHPPVGRSPIGRDDDHARPHRCSGWRPLPGHRIPGRDRPRGQVRLRTRLPPGTQRSTRHRRRARQRPGQPTGRRVLSVPCGILTCCAAWHQARQCMYCMHGCPPRDARYVFVIQRQHDRLGLGQLLRTLRPGSDVLLIDRVTDGPACTVTVARDLVADDEEILVADCDSYLVWPAAWVLDFGSAPARRPAASPAGAPPTQLALTPRSTRTGGSRRPGKRKRSRHSRRPAPIGGGALVTSIRLLTQRSRTGPPRTASIMSRLCIIISSAAAVASCRSSCRSSGLSARHETRIGSPPPWRGGSTVRVRPLSAPVAQGCDSCPTARIVWHVLTAWFGRGSRSPRN